MPTKIIDFNTIDEVQLALMDLDEKSYEKKLDKLLAEQPALNELMDGIAEELESDSAYALLINLYAIVYECFKKVRKDIPVISEQEVEQANIMSVNALNDFNDSKDEEPNPTNLPWMFVQPELMDAISQMIDEDDEDLEEGMEPLEIDEDQKEAVYIVIAVIIYVLHEAK